MAEAGLEVVGVVGVEVAGKREARGQDHEDVGAKLGVPKKGPHLAPEEEAVLQEEVHPGEEHEGHPEPLGEGRVTGEALGVGAEPPGGDRGQGVGHRLKEGHPGEGVPQGGGPGEGQVEEEDRLGRLADPRGEALLLHPGALGEEGLAPRHVELGEDREEKHHDPDPPIHWVKPR